MKKFIVIALLLLLPIFSFGQDGGINRGLISGPNFIPSLVGTTTWGSGSAFTWTFDTGTTDPTIAFGDGTTIFGSGVFTFPNVGLTIYDTNASHYLILAPGSNLTANKTLTLTTGDSDRTITLSGNPTLADWFDQAVKAASTVTFANITDSGLTITRIPFASTGGLLIDDADLTFATDTLSATKLISSASITSPQVYGSSADSGTLTLTSTSHNTKGTISIGRLTLSDLANSDGIVFGSLGTATKAIDLSASGLSGATDYWIYGSSQYYWSTDGTIVVNQVGASIVIGEASVRTPTIHPRSSLTDLVLDTYVNDANIVGRAVANQQAFLVGQKTKVGVLIACTSNGTTTITKTTHGLTLAAGELVHVTGSSTAADKGFYRYVSGDANTIVVDRALSGTQTDVTLTVYKDVISMHATDATNGQMLTSWSAQNKPLQLGGTVLAATATLTSADIVIGANIGLSQTQAASNQAGTLATVHTAGDPGIYFKVIDPATGTAYAVPGWAIP